MFSPRFLFICNVWSWVKAPYLQYIEVNVVALQFFLFRWCRCRNISDRLRDFPGLWNAFEWGSALLLGSQKISQPRLFGDIAAVMIISSVYVCLGSVYQDIWMFPLCPALEYQILEHIGSGWLCTEHTLHWPRQPDTALLLSQLRIYYPQSAPTPPICATCSQRRTLEGKWCLLLYIPKPEASVKTRLEVRGTAAQKKYMGMGSAGLCDIYKDCRPWWPVYP